MQRRYHVEYMENWNDGKRTGQHMYTTCGLGSRANSADMDRMQARVEATMATHAMPSFVCQFQCHTHTGSLNFHWNDLPTHRIRLQTHSHTRALHKYNGLVPLSSSPNLLPPPGHTHKDNMCTSFQTHYLICKREAYGLGPNKDIPCVDEDFNACQTAKDSGQNCTEPVGRDIWSKYICSEHGGPSPQMREKMMREGGFWGMPRHVMVKKGDRPGEWSSTGCDVM